ncbi:hypothetical protein [Streptomonospora wellingtoniae]|uniref:Uncharacterized protein n=1 Tax=Streptomonospora wellingtoniae TaxID=3075544 RepID=A0ABU2KUF8_9ACTN|nr:hypothetical protein [Streptomonospora sp. DSM 45055]MDT0302892.1 hypothetical protein [Streptomonospora sp. DSM 45055]
MVDSQTKQQIQRLSRMMLEQQRQIESLKAGARTPQLSRSSIDRGALEVRDGAGATRARIGWLPDGTVGMVTEGGDPVSAPTAPSVVPVIGGLRVTWDGALANDVALPGDFDHLAVHVSTSSGFTPSAATYQGTIRRAGDGGMLPVIPLPYVEHYVVLVPVTTGGIQGDPSPEVAATPLQVEGPDLVAGSVTAPIIAGGAVTADKLEAILVLASTIVGGIPGGARVELDQDGLRGYDDTNTLIFAIDSAGNAVFSGDITGSTISGSVIEIGEDAPGSNYGVIEETVDGVVRTRVSSMSGARAQIAAFDDQAEFSAWGDDADPSTPAGGVLADPNEASFALYSDSSLAAGAPYVSMSATSGEAFSRHQAPNGSRVQISASDAHTEVSVTPQDSVAEPAITVPGSLYSFRSSTGEIPRVTVQSPRVDTGPGAGLRSLFFLDGTTSTRDYARAELYARRIVLSSDYDGITEATSTEPGVLFLDPTHSVASERHAPKTTAMVSQPTATGTGDWVDFTSGQFPSLAFTAPWSGRVKVVIQMCGYNYGSTNATLATGFRLSGAGTLAADLKRSAMVRCVMSDVSSRGSAGRTATATAYLQLAGNANYTLTPTWRTSTTYDWSRTDASGGDLSQAYDLLYPNDITVEPMM